MNFREVIDELRIHINHLTKDVTEHGVEANSERKMRQAIQQEYEQKVENLNERLVQQREELVRFNQTLLLWPVTRRASNRPERNNRKSANT